MSWPLAPRPGASRPCRNCFFRDGNAFQAIRNKVVRPQPAHLSATPGPDPGAGRLPLCRQAGRFLFLGESENPGELDNVFEVVDKGACIHRKLPGLQLPLGLRRSIGTQLPIPATATLDNRTNVRLFEVLTHQYLPTALLLNQHDELLHVFGNAGQYLRAAGPAGSAAMSSPCSTGRCEPR